MESAVEDLLSQGLSSEVVGLLILNELKCFRKELTQEVRNLGQKLDVMFENCSFPNTSSGSGSQPTNEKRTLDDRSSTWHPKTSFLSSSNSKSSPAGQCGSFKEILPVDGNSLLNKHIAFQMSKSFPDQKKEDNLEQVNLTLTSGEEVVITSLVGNTSLENKNFTIPPPEAEMPAEDEAVNSSNAIVPKKASTDKNKVKAKYTTIYKCTLCSEQFDSMTLYNEHYSAIHGHSTSASLSTMSFWEDQTVKNAFDQPQPKPIFICTVCTRQFSTKGSLLRHSVLHSGVKKYVCKLCGKGFFRSDHLKSHLTTHSRRKLHQCYICMKYFSRSQNFQNHMKLHVNNTELQSKEPTADFADENCADIPNVSFYDSSTVQLVEEFEQENSNADNFCIKSELSEDVL